MLFHKNLGMLFRYYLAIAILLLLVAVAYANPSPIGLNVRDFGAVGNGIANDYPAFASAVSRAASTGETVVVPPGRYRLNSTLTLNGVAMIGISSGNWNSNNCTMPIILPKSTTGPGIRLQNGASVRGLHFVYEWAGSPSSRPPTISLAGVGVRVSECRFESPWDAILSDGASNVGRSIIEDCYIRNVHNIGVRFHVSYDVSWISNVVISSPTSQRFPTAGIGFQFGKNDVLLVSNCRVENAYIGFSIVDQVPGSSITGGTWGSLSDCSADAANAAMLISGGRHCLSISGGSLSSPGIGLRILGSGAEVQIAGVRIRAATGPAVYVENSQSLSIGACTIDRYSTSSTQPAILVLGGAATTIVGNVINSAAAAIQHAPGLTDLVIGANVINEWPGWITGTVFDSMGQPIPYASVFTDVGGYSTQSNASGVYTLADVKSGSYTVTASKIGFNPQSIPVVVVGGQASLCNFTLTSRPILSCAEARLASDNTLIDMAGRIVTAVFPDENCIYVADPDGLSGIRVRYSGNGVSINDLVDVIGGTVSPLVRYGVRSEMEIVGAEVRKIGTASAKLVAMGCRAIGGGATSKFRGVLGGVGVNNIGALVRVAGLVVAKDGDYIYIDDGSGVRNVLSNGAEQPGVRVLPANGSSVAVGDFVGVTGIVEGDVPSGWSENRPFIRCRTTGDLHIYRSH